VNALDSFLQGSSLTAVDTSLSAETPGRRSKKPDVTIYRSDVPQDSYTHRMGQHCYTNFGSAELICELKMMDPFRDPPEDDDDSMTGHAFVLDHIKDSRKQHASKQDLGQNATYAIEINRRQHRCFCFTILIVENRARLLRWDRAGVIVSESFDYMDDSTDYLGRFLLRYARATNAQRGHDTTVSPASKAQEELFRQVVWEKIKRDIPFLYNDGQTPSQGPDALLLTHYEAGGVATVRVEDKCFLISKPSVSPPPEGLSSRGTRGYWAVSEDDRTVAFLKDTWRYNISSMEQEGEILKRLNQEGVENIPTLRYHGSVPGKTFRDIQYSTTDLCSWPRARDSHRCIC
jgi:hypothetical protein